MNRKHTKITKELLDTVKVGNEVKINDWNAFMKVVGI